MVKSNYMNPINLVKSLIKQMEYQEIKVEEGNKIYCVFPPKKYHLKAGRNIQTTFANPSTGVYKIIECIK